MSRRSREGIFATVGAGFGGVIVLMLAVASAAELRWAMVVGLECVVSADAGVGVGAGVGNYGGSVVIKVGPCDVSGRVACGVNDEP